MGLEHENSLVELVREQEIDALVFAAVKRRTFECVVFVNVEEANRVPGGEGAFRRDSGPGRQLRDRGGNFL